MKRTQHYFSDTLAKNAQLASNHGKTSGTIPIEEILQNNWHYSSKNIKIKKGKERVRNCL